MMPAVVVSFLLGFMISGSQKKETSVEKNKPHPDVSMEGNKWVHHTSWQPYTVTQQTPRSLRNMGNGIDAESARAEHEEHEKTFWTLMGLYMANEVDKVRKENPCKFDEIIQQQKVEDPNWKPISGDRFKTKLTR
jgi:hypothetical protein